MAIDYGTLQLADIFVSTKGAKSAQLSDENGALRWTSSAPLTAPFGKKQYNSITVLSIGMSGDYPIAIDCGSTMVRIGSAIFGMR